jgi:hypothetical protein
MRFLFWLSVALNLLLLTSIVAARVDSRREGVTPSVHGGEAYSIDAAAPGGRSIEQIDELVRSLAAADLDAQDIKALAMAWLESSFREAYAPDSTEFWQADYRPGVATLRTQLAIEKQVRAALTEYFGEGAVDDPAFDIAFRPLGPEYDFLHSDAQIRLRESQLESLQSADIGPRSQAGDLARCVPDGAASDPGRRPGRSPDLDPTDEHEYLLRFSPLSQELRRTRAANDEATFRSLFTSLLGLEQDPTPAGQAEIRKSLRLKMGSAAFDRFWSGRDPFYTHVENFLVGQEFSRQQIEQAYSVINRSQQRLLETLGSDANPQAVLRDASRIRREEETELSRLLGDKAAAELADAIRQAAVSVSNRSTIDC